MEELSEGVRIATPSFRDDGICLRCSRCCELKEADGAHLRLTGKYCENLVHLQDGTGFCKVYDTKAGKMLGGGNVCIPAQLAAIFGDLPMDCPYTRSIPGYKTRVKDWMVNDGA
jgi:uncharacterized cysteine cluster protein YcgN (CxxCxxCC family)